MNVTLRNCVPAVVATVRLAVGSSLAPEGCEGTNWATPHCNSGLNSISGRRLSAAQSDCGGNEGEVG